MYFVQTDTNLVNSVLFYLVMFVYIYLTVTQIITEVFSIVLVNLHLESSVQVYSYLALTVFSFFLA